RARAAVSRWIAVPARMSGWPAATACPPPTSGPWRPTCCATACCPATRPLPRAGTASAWSRNCWPGCRCRDRRAWHGQRRSGALRVSATGVERPVHGPVSATEDGSRGVVPTLAELVALRQAAAGRRVPRRGRHGASGPAPSPLRGRGMEYGESRAYTPGADVRHIDWRLTARSGRMHTKLFQAERQRLTLLVADTAPALYFGTRVRFKSVQA